MPTIWLWGGFGWLAALPDSRFEVGRSAFDVQPPAGTSNAGKPPVAGQPSAWLMQLRPPETFPQSGYFGAPPPRPSLRVSAKGNPAGFWPPSASRWERFAG